MSYCQGPTLWCEHTVELRRHADVKHLCEGECAHHMVRSESSHASFFSDSEDTLKLSFVCVRVCVCIVFIFHLPGHI